jgi:protein-tyrosine phosphatase
LELPHDLYLPLEPLMDDLARRHLVAILAHPERNRGLLRQPDLLQPLVDAGCLMQVTAGSLLGTLGPDTQEMAEWMVGRGLVHLVATDAHGPRSRRPLIGRAYERLRELTDESTADNLCIHNPAHVAAGRAVPAGRRLALHRHRASPPGAGSPRQRSGWWARRTSA